MNIKWGPKFMYIFLLSLMFVRFFVKINFTFIAIIWNHSGENRTTESCGQRYLNVDFLFLISWLNRSVKKLETFFILLFEWGLSNEPTLDPELDQKCFMLQPVGLIQLCSWIKGKCARIENGQLWCHRRAKLTRLSHYWMRARSLAPLRPAHLPWEKKVVKRLTVPPARNLDYQSVKTKVRS